MAQHSRIINHKITYSTAYDKSPQSYVPGDFGLVHNKHTFFAKVIRFGQKIYLPKDKRAYAYYNHAFLIVSTNGDIVEAEGKGVTLNNISKYDGYDYAIVNLQDSVVGSERANAVSYGQSSIGQKYAIVTIVALAQSILFGDKLFFGIEDQTICSGLVAGALMACGIFYKKNYAMVMPADLASLFNVAPMEQIKNRRLALHGRRKKGSKLSGEVTAQNNQA